MDKLISTVILTCVSIALAITIMTYYPSLVRSLLTYEKLDFDYAYTSVKGGQVDIDVNFRNTGEGALTIAAIEINGVEMEPKGDSPFPLEIPSGTVVRLRLHGSLDTFRNGVTYEVTIRTAFGRRYVKAVVIP